MSPGPDPEKDPLTDAVAQVMAAYVRQHKVEVSELPALARTIHESLRDAGKSARPPAGRSPAVPIEDSVTDEHIICLEDGKPYQSLKRHLRVAYGLSPDDYREKWGLPADYPMVAPAYARRRSQLAKRSGLGKSPQS